MTIELVVVFPLQWEYWEGEVEGVVALANSTGEPRGRRYRLGIGEDTR